MFYEKGVTEDLRAFFGWARASRPAVPRVAAGHRLGHQHAPARPGQPTARQSQPPLPGQDLAHLGSAGGNRFGKAAGNDDVASHSLIEDVPGHQTLLPTGV